MIAINIHRGLAAIVSEHLLHVPHGQERRQYRGGAFLLFQRPKSDRLAVRIVLGGLELFEAAEAHPSIGRPAAEDVFPETDPELCQACHAPPISIGRRVYPRGFLHGARDFRKPDGLYRWRHIEEIHYRSHTCEQDAESAPFCSSAIHKTQYRSHVCSSQPCLADTRLNVPQLLRRRRDYAPRPSCPFGVLYMIFSPTAKQTLRGDARPTQGGSAITASTL